MNSSLENIQRLIVEGEFLISEHGYDELSNDDISIRDIISGISNAEAIEDYPDFHKGACILVSQKDRLNNPIHIVWGIPTGCEKPAVLVTA